MTVDKNVGISQLIHLIIFFFLELFDFWKFLNANYDENRLQLA